jgi:hypothetical protein
MATLSIPLARAADPLPSWNDTATKKAIVTFVEKVTQPGAPEFVPVPERIATFDNDGTLWSEQPAYFQLLFAFDRVKTLAPQHPEWKTNEPFASLLKGDMKGVAASGEKGLLKIVAVTHAGMSTEDFETIVTDWISTAKHPTTGKLCTEMVFQPMLELLAYLRANGFKTYIVSSGGIEFMRPWTERVYGVPPEQVVGSSIKTQFELQDGKPVLMRLPEVNSIDDKAGKPMGIKVNPGWKRGFDSLHDVSGSGIRLSGREVNSAPLSSARQTSRPSSSLATMTPRVVPRSVLTRSPGEKPADWERVAMISTIASRGRTPAM